MAVPLFLSYKIFVVTEFFLLTFYIHDEGNRSAPMSHSTGFFSSGMIRWILYNMGDFVNFHLRLTSTMLYNNSHDSKISKPERFKQILTLHQP